MCRLSVIRCVACFLFEKAFEIMTRDSKIIKTYNQVNRNNNSASFGISKMEDIYTTRKGILDEPHRHDFFTILLVNHAKGKHIIDFYEYDLRPQQVYFISPGQVHQVIEEEKSIGYSLVFSASFLTENNISIDFIENLNLFHDYASSPPLSLKKEDFDVLNGYCKSISQTYQSDMTFKAQSIGSWLKLFLIQCNNSCAYDDQTIEQPDAKHLILKTFKSKINEKYKAWHDTTSYANDLNITPDHLNRTIKTLTGKTAKEHIQSRIIIAAKRMLYFSSLSTKEIGYALGFTEPAHFSSFFKKCEGISPSQFKKNI